MVLTLPAGRPPGYALDPTTGVPVGTAFPRDLRILTPPFNIAGAFALVFGAIYSAYIFMPKRARHAGRGRAARDRRDRPGGIAVVVNFFASIPGAVRSFRAGTLNSRVPATLLIALGGFVPGLTSGLNRFGITWSLLPGRAAGDRVHLRWLPGQHRGLQRHPAAVHPHRAGAAQGARAARGGAGLRLGPRRVALTSVLARA